jgi:AcrR family transcriptional regulator
MEAVEGPVKPATAKGTADSSEPRRLRRPDRREQILDAATRAFAGSGFAGTSLDDVAAEAGVSRVILYRHFDSKADLYRKILERVCTRLLAACGDRDFTDATLPALVEVAQADADGFRLLFHHATRELEFRDEMSQFSAAMTDTAHAELAGRNLDPAWAQWAAQLSAVVAVQAIIAWLDAGQPEPEKAIHNIRRVLDSILETAGR